MAASPDRARQTAMGMPRQKKHDQAQHEHGYGACIHPEDHGRGQHRQNGEPDQRILRAAHADLTDKILDQAHRHQSEADGQREIADIIGQTQGGRELGKAHLHGDGLTGKNDNHQRQHKERALVDDPEDVLPPFAKTADQSIHGKVFPLPDCNGHGQI